VATSAEVVVPDSERGILLEHYVLIETAIELVWGLSDLRVTEDG
jgi:hypothetical protein